MQVLNNLVKNDLCPKFISNLFCRTNTQTRSNAAFRRPSVNLVYNGELSFRNFGPIVWDDMLPQSSFFLIVLLYDIVSFCIS